MTTRPLLFIIDPIHTLNKKGDTSLAIMQEAQKRGIPTYCCTIDDLFIQESIAHCFAAKTILDLEQDPFFQLSPVQKHSIHDFSVVFMRKDPPVDQRYLLATMMLDCHDPARTQIINKPSSLRIANEKLWPLSIASTLMPDTVVSSQASRLLQAAHDFKRCVIKPTDGRGGYGIMAFEHSDKNLPAAIELLTQESKYPIIVQRYLEEASLGDKRILLINGRPAGAFLRVPSKSDNRANLHVGGKAVATTITERDKEIIATLAPSLQKLGLAFVGIDIIGDYLTEANVTSPTGAFDILRLSNGEINVASQLLDALI